MAEGFYLHPKHERSFFHDRIGIGDRHFVKRSQDDRDRKNAIVIFLAFFSNQSFAGQIFQKCQSLLKIFYFVNVLWICFLHICPILYPISLIGLVWSTRKDRKQLVYVEILVLKQNLCRQKIDIKCKNNFIFPNRVALIFISIFHLFHISLTRW